MYTRSYPRAGTRNPPPDYGGTALVIGTPPVIPRTAPEPAERIPRRPTAPCQDCIGTPGKPEEAGQQIPPPFGKGDPGDADGGAGVCGCRPESLSGECFPASLFDPGHLKNDDLLLLGLIFLMLKEGENREGCREMLLILAVLYLSGK